jgi:hypothetical protein
MRHARTRLTGSIDPSNTKREAPGAVGAGAHRAHRTAQAAATQDSKQTPRLKPGNSTISNRTHRALTN